MPELEQQSDALTFVCDLERKWKNNYHKLSRWTCVCGNVVETRTDWVKRGQTKSCGCLSFRKTNLRHGFFGTPTYSSWRAMKGRCGNPAHKDYPRYGARGISFCERWDIFENFLEDMGIRPEGTSLDRYPNRHGGYEPGNCRWAATTEQEHNKDSFVVINTPLGVMPLIEYAPKIGLTIGAAHMRLKRGKLEGCNRA